MRDERAPENLAAVAAVRRMAPMAAAANAANVVMVAKRVVCKRFAQAVFVAQFLVAKLSAAAVHALVLFVAVVAPVALAALKSTTLLLAVLVAALLVARTVDRALLVATVVAVDCMPAFVGVAAAVAVQDVAGIHYVAAADPHADGRAHSLAQNKWNWCCTCDRCYAPPMQLAFRQGRHAAPYDSMQAVRLVQTSVESKYSKMFVVLRIVHPNQCLLVFAAAVVASHSVCSALRRRLCSHLLCPPREDAVYYSRGHRAAVMFAESCWIVDCHVRGSSSAENCRHTAIGVC